MKIPGTKKFIPMVIALTSIGLAGCGTAMRTCPTCIYKSAVTFSGLPSGTITSAQVTIKVKHSGACPQSDKPNNCTEVMRYNVKCMLGTAEAITIPFFIDAGPTIRSHTASLVVDKAGTVTTHAGVVDFSSNVTGGAAPPSTMLTPCPPPSMNPYSPFPAIE